MLGVLSPREIEGVLHSQTIGRIGCHSDGRTYVVPTVYAYDGFAIYCLSGEGLKLDMLRSNPNACFEVEVTKGPGSWRSVIAWGHFQELEGDEADRGVKLVRQRLTERTDAQPAIGTEGNPSAEVGIPGAVAYRLILDERTGRFGND